MPNKSNLETAKAMLAGYLQAESAVLSGQTVTFKGRTVSMSDLSSIRIGRAEWERRVAELENTNPNIGGLGFSVATFS